MSELSDAGRKWYEAERARRDSVHNDNVDERYGAASNGQPPDNPGPQPPDDEPKRSKRGREKKTPPPVIPFAVTLLSDVTAEKVSWLWRGWLPVGKVITLDGDPGLGKSTLGLTFSAIITTAGVWPDGTRCEYPGDVILMSAEDGLADTIRPRFDSAGGDATRVHAVQGIPYSDDPADGVRLPTLDDIAQLRQLVTDTGARLVVIDVLMAFMPSGTDSHRDQDVRRVLARLAKLAADNGCTIVLLRHLNKGRGGDPMYRGGGSIGIVGASRVGLMVAPDPDDDGLSVLAQVKNNLAPKAESRSYRIVPDELRDVSRIQWVGVSDHDAEALLSDHDGSANDATQRWIMTYLSAGPRWAAQGLAAAKAASYSEAMIQRARKALHIASVKDGKTGFWYWHTPEQDRKPPQQHTALQPCSLHRSDEFCDCSLAFDDYSLAPEEEARMQGCKAASAGGTAFLPSDKLPTGPGRCGECGFHTPTQGHRTGCPANDDEPF